MGGGSTTETPRSTPAGSSVPCALMGKTRQFKAGVAESVRLKV